MTIKKASMIYFIVLILSSFLLRGAAFGAATLISPPPPPEAENAKASDSINIFGKVKYATWDSVTMEGGETLKVSGKTVVRDVEGKKMNFYPVLVLSWEMVAIEALPARGGLEALEIREAYWKK